MPVIEKKLWFCLFLLLAVQAVSWMTIREEQAQWLNVPPVPSKGSIYSSALGDGQLAYRSMGVMLQNLGDMHGRATPLKDYNYKDLSQWFLLSEELDNKSDYMPYIASYYYGGLDQETEKLRPLIAYLFKVGQEDYGEKWRWLAHAVYLARFKLNDLDYALQMANVLADKASDPDSGLPNWARQMPAFILNAKGDKEAALQIMVNIIASVGDKIHPNEVNHTRGYICEDIFTPEEAKNSPICEGDF